MNIPSDTVQRAIADLTTIRQTIEKTRTSSEKASKALALSYRTHRFLISLCSIVALLLLITEISFDSLHTKIFLASAVDTDIKFFGLLNAAMFLIIGCGSIYFIAYRAAKKAAMSLEEFIALNFQYLRNMSFLSDLFIKFSFFCAVITLNKPDWIAPLLSLFTADYLIQGRFFIIPLISSYILAVVCFVAAALQLYYESPFVGAPLLLFCIACGLSLYHIAHHNPHSNEDEEKTS